MFLTPIGTIQMKKLPTAAAAAAAAAALLRALAHVLDTHGCYWRRLLATGYVHLLRALAHVLDTH